MSNTEMERLLDRPMAITRREYNADMLTASKMGNAAAVAEARAPLVEALRPFVAAWEALAKDEEGFLTPIAEWLDSEPLAGGHFGFAWHVEDFRRAAAALAKETP